MRFASETGLPFANKRVCEKCSGQFPVTGQDVIQICMRRGFTGELMMDFEGERMKVMHGCPFMLETIMANEEDG
jgi:hypothetical protein